jgi:hypothetical protein
VVLSVMVGVTLAALLAVTLAAHGGGAAIVNTVSKARPCTRIPTARLASQEGTLMQHPFLRTSYAPAHSTGPTQS